MTFTKKHLIISILTLIILLTILFNLGDTSFKKVAEYIPPTSQTAAVSDFDSNLVAHYTFDGTANDSAGSNTGTVVGGPTYVTGKIGQGLSFDGSDDYVDIPSLSAPTDKTYSLWIKATSLPNVFNTLIEFGNDSPWFGALSNSTISLYNGNPSTSGTITLNQWYHIVYTSDSNSNVSKIYINGVQDATTGTANTQTGSGLGIGRHVGEVSFHGSIDDVRIYNRVLSAGEIVELYTYTGLSQTIPADVTSPVVPQVTPPVTPPVIPPTTPPVTSPKTPSSGTTFYIRDGATGSSCSDWGTNACDTLPQTLIRGATYYIADGTYPTYIFDDAIDGTKIISIIKATNTDHGSNTGWSNVYGDGVSEFGPVSFRRSYYVFDGKTGGGHTQWRAGHGFKIRLPNGGAGVVIGDAYGSPEEREQDRTDIFIRHLEISGNAPVVACSNIGGAGIGIAGGKTGHRNLEFSHLWLHDLSIQMQGAFMQNVILEESVLERNKSSDACHSEAWAAWGPSSDVTIRNNLMSDIEGTAYIALELADRWQIYNNIFMCTNGRPYACGVGNGVIGTTDHTNEQIKNFQVHHNIFVNIANATVDMDSPNGPPAQNNTVYNNIFFNNSAVNFSGVYERDYNWFYGNTSNAALAGVETHGLQGTSDPFIDWKNLDFRLKAPLGPGKLLVAPFDRDLAGVRRGIDGVWDIGAYEYVGVSPTADTTINLTPTTWNAMSGSSFVRGMTYILAPGIYQGKVLSTPANGTSLITIKGSGTGQVLFTGTGVSFSSNYWIFDGVVGSGSNPNSYGFYFTPPLFGSSIRPVEYNGSYIQIRHTAVTCPGPGGDIQQFGFSGFGNFVSTDHTYANNCQVSYWNQGSDNVISNSYMGTHWSSATNHGVHVMQVLRPSFFNNIIVSCPIMCIEPGGGATTNINNGKYYNNVFLNVTGTNGVWKGTSSGAIIDTVIYGNTFINISYAILQQNNLGAGYGSGNVMINNLLYNSPTLYYEADAGVISHSYNSFFNSGTVSETGAQIGTGDPFVNLSAGDYHLKINTNPGMILPNPFNTDIEGKLRTTWTRGAYEYTGGAVTPPITPPVTPPTTYTPGDFNHDGLINSLDLSLLTSAWNQSNTTYDLNTDGIVNSLDYVIMVKNWTK